MKKFIKNASLVLGAIAIIGMGINFWAYRTFQKWMILRLPELPSNLVTWSTIVVIVILLSAAFHLALLFHTFFFITRLTNKYFLSALFFNGLILSGMLLLSDAALLSDLGKEYLLWDVTQEWNLLYFFSTLHMAVMLIGWLLLLTNNEPFPFSTLPKAKKLDESLFIITIQVGLIAGIIGILMLPSPQFLGILKRYHASYIITLSLLALLPLASVMSYWLFRNRGKNLSELVDEKQFQDVTFGALLAMVVVVFAVLSGIGLSHFSLIDLNNPVYSFLLIDMIIITINITVLIRSRQYMNFQRGGKGKNLFIK